MSVLSLPSGTHPPNPPPARDVFSTSLVRLAERWRVKDQERKEWNEFGGRSLSRKRKG